MSSKVCQDELNRQLQVLQSRVNQIEKNVNGLNETTLTHIGQSVAAFAALIDEGIVTGLPTFIANQLMLKLAAAALGMSESSLSGFPGMGSAGSLLTDVTSLAESILATVLQIMSEPSLEDVWKKLVFKLVLQLLQSLPYGPAFVSAMLTSLQADVDSAQAALSLDPLNTALQAALESAQNSRDSSADGADSQDRLTACKILTSLIGTT